VSFENTLWDSLTGYSSLSTLISTRLYRSRAELKPTLPYVRMYQVKNKPVQALNGAISVENPVFVFQIFALTDEETISIRNALRGALLSASYPILFEDDVSDSDAGSGLRRRDMTVRIAH
jgi:hypothetical protein